MAYKDSESIQSGTSYPLGDYSFNCVFDDSPTLGQFARASMTKDGQTVYKTVSLPNNANILGYTVEANSDTADVYAVIKVPIGGTEHETTLDISPLHSPIPTCGSFLFVNEELEKQISYTGATLFGIYSNIAAWTIIAASSSPNSIVTYEIKTKTSTARNTLNLNSQATINGKTVYFTSFGPGFDWEQLSNLVSGVYQISPTWAGDNTTNIAWSMIYGTVVPTEYEEKTMLVGRFAIEIEDAGGVGPYSDWTDPGDWDDDWGPGEPTHTLNVEIDGALSGRHNDPLNDTSYSYIPADKATEKDYGCGGDGGNGGGGGAGASSIVVYKFATGRANSKEIVCKPKRHGYGSGGGKGGKGGNGCILVYY